MNTKGNLKLDWIEEKYLLFFVNNVMHEINAKENENLLETICEHIGSIEMFRDEYDYSTEQHRTIDWSEPCTIELLYDYPEYILDYIRDSEDRWEIVIED